MFVPQPNRRYCIARGPAKRRKLSLAPNLLCCYIQLFLDTEFPRVKENFILSRAWAGATRGMLNRRRSEAGPDASIAAGGATSEPEEIEFPKATRRAFVRGTLLSWLLLLGRFLLVDKSAASRTVSQNESSFRQTPIVGDAAIPKFFPPVRLQVLEKYIEDLLVGSVNCCVVRLLLGTAGNFVLGAFMTLGIGRYAPCMILVSLLGMNPKSAFPIMMGSCAFLMPIGSVQIIRSREYRLGAALALLLGGIPGVLLAALLVKSLPLSAVRWLVVLVVLYTIAMMLRSAALNKRERAEMLLEASTQ